MPAFRNARLRGSSGGSPCAGFPQAKQAFEMLRVVRRIAMIRSDSFQRQAQSPSDAGGNEFRMAVQDIGRKMGKPAVAGEQVATEQQAAGFTVKAAVAVGVAGEMDDFQSAPNGDGFTVFKAVVNLEPRTAEDDPARFFEHIANPCQTLIGISGLAMRLIQGVDCDPTIRCGGNLGDIEDVIQMSMGEQDAADRELRPPAPIQRAMQQTDSSHETGVDQVKAVSVPQHVKANTGTADLEEIVMCGVFGHGF